MPDHPATRKKPGRKKECEKPGYTERVARTLMQVLVETGRINYKETRARLYPKAADSTNSMHAYKLITPEVREEFLKLITADDNAVYKLNHKDIIKDILTDLKRIDVMLNDPELEVDEMNKLSTTKTAKQKLLGQYLGIWKEDKKAPEDEASPDSIFNKYQERYSLLN